MTSTRYVKERKILKATPRSKPIDVGTFERRCALRNRRYHVETRRAATLHQYYVLYRIDFLLPRSLATDCSRQQRTVDAGHCKGAPAGGGGCSRLSTLRHLPPFDE